MIQRNLKNELSRIPEDSRDEVSSISPPLRGGDEGEGERILEQTPSP
jgi:hypothetical protein